MVLLATFAIDRLVNGILFLMRCLELLKDPETEGTVKDKREAEDRFKLVYFIFAAVLALLALTAFPNVRILASLGRPVTTSAEKMFDIILTAIVYVGGAERISGLLKIGTPGPVVEEPAKPIEVRGSIDLVHTASASGDRAHPPTATT
jgi:hypothetical protein